MLFIDWLYGEQTPGRPAFPAGMTSQQLEEESRYYDLAPHAPKVDWPEAFKHLPETAIFKAVDGPPGIFADSVKAIATGGQAHPAACPETNAARVPTWAVRTADRPGP